MTKLIILFLLFNSTLFGQRIVKLSQEVDKYYHENQFDKAILALEKLEQSCENKNKYRRDILYFSYLSNDSILFYKTLKRFDVRDSFNTELLLENTFTKFAHWKDSLSISINTAQNKLGYLLDSLYENEIIHRSQMSELYQQFKDQKIDKTTFDFKKDSIFLLQEPLDIINHQLFDSIINDLGYMPGYDELNLKQVHTLFIILQHHKNNEQKKKLIRYYQRKMKRGLLPYTYYVQIVDRYNSAIDKYVQFGMAIKINEEGKTVSFGKMRSKRKVNKNRVNYGLGPITF